MAPLTPAARALSSYVDRYCVDRDEAAAMDRDQLAAEIDRLDQLERETGPLPETDPLRIRLHAFIDEFQSDVELPF